MFVHLSAWTWVNLSAERNKRESRVKKKTHTIRGFGNSSSLHNYKIQSTYVIMRPLSLLSTRWHGINQRLMSLYWCAIVTILIPCFGQSSVDHDFVEDIIPMARKCHCLITLGVVCVSRIFFWKGVWRPWGTIFAYWAFLMYDARSSGRAPNIQELRYWCKEGVLKSRWKTVLISHYDGP